MTLRHVSNFIHPELQFASAMASAGIPCGEPITADGTLHRFRTGDDHSENCWYVLHFNGVPAGAFGCWKRGITETWCAVTRESMSDAEYQQVRERIANTRVQRERAEAQRQAEARTRAAELWVNAKPVVTHE